MLSFLRMPMACRQSEMPRRDWMLRRLIVGANQ